VKTAHKLRVVVIVILLMTIPVCTIAEAQNPGNQAALKWSIQTVDSTGGLDTSLVLDASGNPHISYIADNILKYAVWTGSSWNIQTVDSTGADNSLVLDDSGNAHISYRGNEGLKYAV
jgi:hypothetical protein